MNSTILYLFLTRIRNIDTKVVPRPLKSVVADFSRTTRAKVIAVFIKKYISSGKIRACEI